jgi:hypothetical protein
MGGCERLQKVSNMLVRIIGANPGADEAEENQAAEAQLNENQGS